MDNAELLRYNRQILLPEIDIDGQEKLLASTVAIIGLGGLGAPVAIYLASAGIGHLILVDDDVVEETNLQRQIVHFESNLQESKVSSAAETVRLINSSTKVTQIDHRLSVSDYLDLLSTVDVAIDATDNADSRYTLNRACLDSKVPLVSGAAVRMEGQVAVFDSTSRIPLVTVVCIRTSTTTRSIAQRTESHPRWLGSSVPFRQWKRSRS